MCSNAFERKEKKVGKLKGSKIAKENKTNKENRGKKDTNGIRLQIKFMSSHPIPPTAMLKLIRGFTSRTRCYTNEFRSLPNMIKSKIDSFIQ